MLSCLYLYCCCCSRVSYFFKTLMFLVSIIPCQYVVREAIPLSSPDTHRPRNTKSTETRKGGKAHSLSQQRAAGVQRWRKSGVLLAAFPGQANALLLGAARLLLAHHSKFTDEKARGFEFTGGGWRQGTISGASWKTAAALISRVHFPDEAARTHVLQGFIHF